MRKNFFTVLFIITVSFQAFSQQVFNADTVTFGKFDNGKMWTFDNPPVDYFEKVYGFKPSQEWLDDVQMSALRFATYCSASFVSADGLVMTNHHCARESGTAVQKKEKDFNKIKGEDFNKNGFYAKTLKEERKVPGLFVDQLVKRIDVTPKVRTIVETYPIDKQDKVKDSVLNVLKKEYEQNADWKGLEIQAVTFYKGGKYSLYGFKRYTDVRLVFMPELNLGFFGGDPDNFTYPRYALDCSFFRVYDENGKPFKPAHYFKFNPEGAKKDEAVFVIGNPGRTDRLATNAQLNFFQNEFFPKILQTIRSRADILHEYNKEAKSDSILNEVFSLENSYKALTGQFQGLNDPYIRAKKNAFEKDFKEKVAADPKLKTRLSIWDDIAACRKSLAYYYPTIITLTYRDWNAASFNAVIKLAKYADLAEKGKDTAAIAKLARELSTEQLTNAKSLEGQLLAAQLKEINDRINPKILGNLPHQNFNSIADLYITESKVFEKDALKNWVNKGPEAIKNATDPLIVLGITVYRQFKLASEKADSITKKDASLTAQLAKLQFDVYGDRFTPDANFCLRIADGRVKGYSYNGTEAPYKTTYYGLYDRWIANDKAFPWSLPEKWQKPGKELLKSPMNFASTNDIIGGNSGSPMINIKKEVVGLIFDGNMESLPGRFIFLEEKNRTISVHAGGMYAALKYVYKAKRLIKELDKK